MAEQMFLMAPPSDADADTKETCTRIICEMQERYRQQFMAEAAPYMKILTDIAMRTPPALLLSTTDEAHPVTPKRAVSRREFIAAFQQRGLNYVAASECAAAALALLGVDA